MAEAADYFIGALDTYQKGAERKQQLQMQQEEHDLQMRQGRMQLDQMQKQADSRDQLAGYIENSANGATPQYTPTPETKTPAWDSSALQQTVDQVSGYMNHINDARGNSGFGQAISLHPQEDGSLVIGAANAEVGGANPFTVDPKNNNSAPLRIPADHVGTVNAYVRGQIDAAGGDPAKLEALARNNFGLVHDENGIVTAPTQSQQAGTNYDTSQSPQTPGTTRTIKQSSEVSVRFTQKVNHDPVAFKQTAESPDLDVTDRDRKDLQSIDTDGTHAVTMPAARRGKIAALMLRSGYANIDQALNFAQTGFTNMNSVELDDALTRTKANKVQLKKAEYDYWLDVKYAAREKEARLAEIGASTVASHARTATSISEKKNHDFDYNQKQLDRLNKMVGSASDNIMTAGNVDPEAAKQTKAAMGSAIVSAVTSSGIDPRLFTGTGSGPKYLEELSTRTAAIMNDPKSKARDANSAAQQAIQEFAARSPDRDLKRLPQDYSTEGKKTETFINGVKESVKNIAAGPEFAGKGGLKDGAVNRNSAANVDRFANDVGQAVDTLNIMKESWGIHAYSGKLNEDIFRHWMAITKGGSAEQSSGAAVVAITNSLAHIPADKSAEQWGMVAPRLSQLSRLTNTDVGADFYNKVVTSVANDPNVKPSDVINESIKRLDSMIEERSPKEEAGPAGSNPLGSTYQQALGQVYTSPFS